MLECMYFVSKGLDESCDAESRVPHHSERQSGEGVVGRVVLAFDELPNYVQAGCELAVGDDEEDESEENGPAHVIPLWFQAEANGLILCAEVEHFKEVVSLHNVLDRNVGEVELAPPHSMKY